jgi:hypothetical protein
MKTIAIAMLLLTTCCWGVSVCAQAPDSSSETELHAAMAECRNAALEGDLEKIAGCLADQYLQTDIAGYVQDKTAWLNEYAKPLAALIKAGKFRWEIYDPKDVQIRMYGDADTHSVREALENQRFRFAGKSIPGRGASNQVFHLHFALLFVLNHPVELEPEGPSSGKPLEQQGRSAQQRAGR